MNSTAIDNSADIIDSRDVIERIAYLKAAWSEATGDESSDYALSQDDWQAGLDEDEAAEIVALLALEEEASNYASDWIYGAALIRDSYFTDYARELAEEIGAIPSDYSWPTSHIDWEDAARALRQDYSEVEFNGVTYLTRV